MAMVEMVYSLVEGNIDGAAQCEKDAHWEMPVEKQTG